MTVPVELYGPFGALIILVIGIVSIVRAFLTRKVVPGWLYDREYEARERAEAREAVLLRQQASFTKIAANGANGNGSPDNK